MSTQKITKTAARAELTRRSRSKDDPKRREFPARHIMETSTGELRAIAGKPARSTRKPAATAPDTATVTDAITGLPVPIALKAPKATVSAKAKAKAPKVTRKVPKADPVKAAAARHADATGAARGSGAWWTAYRELTAAYRAGLLLDA